MILVPLIYQEWTFRLGRCAVFPNRSSIAKDEDLALAPTPVKGCRRRIPHAGKSRRWRSKDPGAVSRPHRHQGGDSENQAKRIPNRCGSESGCDAYARARSLSSLTIWNATLYDRKGKGIRDAVPYYAARGVRIPSSTTLRW